MICEFCNIDFLNQTEYNFNKHKTACEIKQGNKIREKVNTPSIKGFFKQGI